jgi:hypothetical protein
MLRPHDTPPSLLVHHKPGMQVLIKFRGASCGLILALIRPLLLLPVTLAYRSSLESLDCIDMIIGDQYHHCKRSGNGQANMSRFIYVICYLVTGTGYTLLRDFITWTCTLESLTLNMNNRVKELWITVSDSNGRNSRQVEVPPFHGLNYLGDSSSLSLWYRQHHRLSKTRAGSLTSVPVCRDESTVLRITNIYLTSP